MSSFFTLPASQRKRKRAEDGSSGKTTARKGQVDRSTKKPRQQRDDSISGSDSEDLEGRPDSDVEESSSEDEDEDVAARRTRLAARYLENTRKDILAEGFDAKDIDNELLAQRMGERLKEDTAESKGRIYRWIADDYKLDGSTKVRLTNGAGVLTGVAVCSPHIYTVSKSSRLSKWQLPADTASRKPKLVSSKQGNQKKKKDPKYNQHAAAIYCVAASADGKFVATGDKHGKLVVWDAATLEPLQAFTQHRDAVTSLSFRRGTNQLFSASRDRTVKVWSLDELAYVETLYGHQDQILDVASLNQEHCVTAGARDRTARFWKVVEENQLVFRGGGGHDSLRKVKHDNGDIATEEKIPMKPFHEGSIDRITMIDEDTFVTGSDNGAISLWNVHKKKPVFTYPCAHGIEQAKSLNDISPETNPSISAIPEPQPRWITALTSIPYSNIFFSGSWDGHIRAWKITEDKKRIEALGTVEAAAEAQSNGTYESINGAYEQEAPVKGCINDIAVYEVGKSGEDGIGLVAVTGKEHRLGVWQKLDGSNVGVAFRIPKKLA